jgi:hypothetical protein
VSAAWADRVDRGLGHDGSGTIEPGLDGCGARRRRQEWETVEAFDHKHELRAERALDLSGGRGLWWCSSGVEQQAATPQRSGTLAVGEEPEVADADQAFWQNMDEEAPQELVG